MASQGAQQPKDPRMLITAFEKMYDIVKSSVTHEELDEAIKLLVQNMRAMYEEFNAEMRDELDFARKANGDIIDDLESRLTNLLTQIEQKSGDSLDDIRQQFSDDVNNLRNLIPTLPDYSDKFAELEAKIPVIPDFPKIPEFPEIPQPDMAEDIRNKLELLQGEERLDRSAIRGLDDYDDIKKAVSEQKSEGGVSNMRIIQAFKYILKTENPTGDIDGVNTAYTVSQPIFAVLSFSLNGEIIAQLPNYTVSNRTITFSTALPAAYSGRDFEIKYI